MIAEVMRAVQALRPGLVAAPAFLDLSEPDLTAAVAALQEDGPIAEAIVLPLLFTEAFHAKRGRTDRGPRGRGSDGRRASARLHPRHGRGRAAGAGGFRRPGAHRCARGNPAAGRRVEPGQRERSRQGPGRPVEPAAARPGVGRVSRPPVNRRPRRYCKRAVKERRRLGVVPLFLAPGLLLDTTARQAMELDMEVAEPLGTALAGLVLRRYDEALALARA